MVRTVCKGSSAAGKAAQLALPWGLAAEAGLSGPCGRALGAQGSFRSTGKKTPSKVKVFTRHSVVKGSWKTENRVGCRREGRTTAPTGSVRQGAKTRQAVSNDVVVPWAWDLLPRERREGGVTQHKVD